MVILVADHPVIVVAEFKIRLPQAIVVFSLKTLSSPGLSRLSYRMIQARFTDDLVGLIVIDCEAFVVEAPCYLLWTPIVAFP